MYVRIAFFVSLMLFAAASCASAQLGSSACVKTKAEQEPAVTGVLLERYSEPPEWRNTLRVHLFDQVAGTHYFFGTGTSSDKEESRTKALSNALSMVSKQLFVRIKYGTNNYTEQVLGEDVSVVKDVSIERGANIIVKNYEASLYTEKWRRDGVSVFDSWCRLEIAAGVYDELVKEGTLEELNSQKEETVK